MKKRMLALLLCALLTLPGCSRLLVREYASITPHSATPTAEGSSNILRVESYQELVNALLYLVVQGQDSGFIRLYLDSALVEQALEAACLEVVQEDPLGAYAVDFIKYSLSPIVACYEADVQITYRRTPEQVAAIVAATGATAIRSELQETLSAFQTEKVLRISYFEGDEAYIQRLVREAYYSAPAYALDLPEVTVSIYPDSGRQRIVEVLLTYHLSPQELEQRHKALEQRAIQICAHLWNADGDQGILDTARQVLSAGGYLPQGGATAYHALLEDGADSQGLALAMSLLCQGLEVPCQVVSGTLDGQPHFWNVVSTQSGYRHLDLTGDLQSEAPFRSDRDMVLSGYSWDSASTPLCGEQPED